MKTTVTGISSTGHGGNCSCKESWALLSQMFFHFSAKDATDDFEDVGHSTTARAMMDEYYVGDIDASTIPAKVKYTPPKQPHYNQDKTSDFIIKILQFLVPLVILGLAVGVRIYTKSE